MQDGQHAAGPSPVGGAAVADDRNLRAALAYATAGWRVFPCIPGVKVPATSARRQGRHHRPARRSGPGGRGTRTGMWRSPPARPGPDVLDVYRRRPTPPASRRCGMLRAAGLIAGRWPRLVRTPSGGAHLYPAPPAARRATAACAVHPHRLPQRRRLRPRPALGSAVGVGRPPPMSLSATRPTGDPIDWAQVREHLEPQRERRVGAAARRPRRRAAKPGPSGGPDGGPARGEPQRVPALGRQPRPRSRPGRAAAPTWLRLPWQRAWTGARPTAPSSPPGAPERQDPPAIPQPRGPPAAPRATRSLRTPRRPRAPAKQQEPQRGRAAVLEAGTPDRRPQVPP